MQNQDVSKQLQPKFWFGIFVTLHLAAWTLVPALVRNNLPMDAIEGTIWGHQLEWGYDKNPFLNGWLTALATFLDGQSGWMLYLFCQLSVAACLIAVWKLGKKFMPPAYALASVLLLEGIQYYNFHALDFNDNTLELGLWAGAIYFFYQAIHKKTRSAWLMTAILLGLGMMAKYYTLALIAALGLYLLRKENRGQLATWPPYLGLAVFLAMLIPHTIWLTQHHYVTITYMMDRGSAVPDSLNHLYFPIEFIWQQLEAFLPALILFCLLFIGKRPLTATQPIINTEDKTFLFYAGFGPFLLTVILSLCLGIKLRAGWGMPLMSFWPMLLMAALPPRLSHTKLIVLLTGIFAFMAALLIGYSVSLIDSPDKTSANFPGKEIATAVTQRWRDTYHTPVSYVAGRRWLAGNVSFYSAEQPAVFMEWDTLRSPWINLSDLKKKGAIFVWDTTHGEPLPAKIAASYPGLSKPIVMEFNWQRNRHQLPPIKLGVVFLPPEQA